VLRTRADTPFCSQVKSSFVVRVGGVDVDSESEEVQVGVGAGTLSIFEFSLNTSLIPMLYL
jgi:hypothetical protein